MQKALFVLVFFLAYTVQAITGFAGNILAMPAGISLLGFNEVVAVLNVLGFLGCTALAIMGWKHIIWREFIKMTSVMLGFMFLGIWLDTIVSLDALRIVFGVFILAVGARNLLVKRTHGFPDWALWIFVALAGVVQGMFVSGGAFLVIYAVQKIRDKDAFRATLSLVWGVLNLIYSVITLIGGSFANPDTQMVVLLCIPALVVATWLGNRLQHHISQHHFMIATYALLVIIGVIMVVSTSISLFA